MHSRAGQRVPRAAYSQNSWLQRPTSVDDPDLSSMSAVRLYTGHSGQRALPEPCKTSSSRPLDSAAVEYIWSEIVRLHAVLKVTCDCVCKRKLSAVNAACCQQFSNPFCILKPIHADILPGVCGRMLMNGPLMLAACQLSLITP